MTAREDIIHIPCRLLSLRIIYFLTTNTFILFENNIKCNTYWLNKTNHSYILFKVPPNKFTVIINW